MKGRQSAIDDPDQHVLEVVYTSNDGKMAGCAVWEQTKAMTDEDWERARKEAPGVYTYRRGMIYRPNSTSRSTSLNV